MGILLWILGYKYKHMKDKCVEAQRVDWNATVLHLIVKKYTVHADQIYLKIAVSYFK